MIIPGFVIALLTFPGVIVHELAHQFFCILLKVPVFKVCYIRVGNPSGYVLHEHPHSPWKSLLISFGPLLVNTILGFIIALPAVIGTFTFDSGDALDALLIWLGFSIAMHSFPSTGDAATLWKSVLAPGVSPFAKVITVPLTGLIWIGAVGSVFWLDAIYGFLVIGLLPGWILSVFA
jgi:hypothetical protein